MKLPSATTEFLYSSMSVDHDLTSVSIDVALPTQGSDPQTWIPATVIDVVKEGERWTSTFRILVGPNGGVKTLTTGSIYDWWNRAHDNPETPIRKAGIVEAT